MLRKVMEKGFVRGWRRAFTDRTGMYMYKISDFTARDSFFATWI